MFKADWAFDGPIPWSNPEVAAAEGRTERLSRDEVLARVATK